MLLVKKELTSSVINSVMSYVAMFVPDSLYGNGNYRSVLSA